MIFGFKRVSGLLAAGLTLISINLSAQRRPLDLEALDNWKHVAETQLTQDGKVVCFEVKPQAGYGELVFERGKQNLKIARGCDAVLSDDGKHAWFRIKAADKSSKDSLGCVNLKSFRVNRYPSMTSFSTGSEKQPYCAYLSSYTKDGSKYRSLVILNPENEEADTLRKVSSYVFSQDGKRLAATVKSGKKENPAYSVIIYDIAGKRKKVLFSDAAFCSKPSFSQDGKRLVFLASSDTSSTGDRPCSLMLCVGGECREILASNKSKNGWSVNQDAKPVFSSDGKRVFLYVSPESDPKADSSAARLAIWRYDAPMTPPQEAMLSGKKTFRAVLNLDGEKKLIPLPSNPNDEVRLLGGGSKDYALSLDREPYMISESWDYKNRQDLYLVSLRDGSRKEIAKNLSGFVSVSPAGSCIAWFDLDKRQWFSYKTADGSAKCLTSKTGVNFFIEDNDRPREAFPYCQSPVWTDDDESLLVSDRYDIWQLSSDGSGAVNLTSGYGRKNGVRFRCSAIPDRKLSEEEKTLDNLKGIDPKEKLYLKAFEEGSMRQGLASVEPGSAKEPYVFLDTMSFSIAAKAGKADVVAFLKGNFSAPEDLYLTNDDWKSSSRITDANPQRDDYSWGTARQVKWTAYDGTPLSGILYVPELAGAGSKCPMIVYFYERLSETLYDWTEPALSLARINIPYMCSNGYAVFVPDVVFKTGHPGESSFNCVVSGTEAMLEQFPFIDKANIGVNGQSWGGYQTAYLITRTKLFKAAAAGAPVSNMTSAYGGIRWESGVVRAWQYERDQSRIGKSLWEEGGRDLYIENSPVFFADKVRTALLIVANDADGAVPWYQGIEYFSALRRLGSPAWMLQYKNEGHKLSHRENRRDLTIKISGYFDHYLKGAPEPEWMKSE